MIDVEPKGLKADEPYLYKDVQAFIIRQRGLVKNTTGRLRIIKYGKPMTFFTCSIIRTKGKKFPFVQ